MRYSALTLVFLLGCGHSDAFETDPPVKLDRPFQPGVPVQFTLNIAADDTPSWSQDGSTIFWSAQQPLPGTLDSCISQLPVTGGTLTELQCPAVFDGLRSRYYAPATRDTLLAYGREESSTSSPFAFHTFSLWLSGIRPKSAPSKLLDFPYSAPSGRPHDMPLFLQWLKPGVLLYLGMETGGCCADDTLRFGEQVVLLDVSGTTPTRTFVPGTERASAVSGSADGTTIYYTFPGDSVVFQQVLATGTVTPLHNFGLGHIVRDPSVAGNRLVAVIDGRPKTQDLVPFGVVNVDFGGELAVVDLTTGGETILNIPPYWYRHPRFSPDGSRFVVEAFPYTITYVEISPGTFRPDTAVSLINDIWVWEE